jgi:hypothetical protein
MLSSTLSTANATYTAFQGARRVASGPAGEVAVVLKQLSLNSSEPVLAFDDTTGAQTDLDLRGTESEIRSRYPSPTVAPTEEEGTRGPGRPKLGVVPREVTLLPRHWEWLGAQPGGASVALRKLVHEAMRTSEETDRIRRAREAAYRFISVMAGNLSGFEEASRALYSGDAPRFEQETRAWPEDVRNHALAMSRDAFSA